MVRDQERDIKSERKKAKGETEIRRETEPHVRMVRAREIKRQRERFAVSYFFYFLQLGFLCRN